MAKPRVSEEEFIALLNQFGAAETARRLGTNVRSVFGRRARLEKKLDRAITLPHHTKVDHPQRVPLSIETGIVLVGSDAHIWPGPMSTAMRAFIHFAKEMKPKAVILNGDVMDCSTISRYPPIGWENRPTVQQEIEAAQEQLHAIEKAAGRARKIWLLGNHDARYETRLATIAPEFAKVQGMHLKDHFPLWEPGWACWINDNVVVKHRFKSGIHAPHNNTLWAGKSIITGHLHSARVVPLTDYSGTRYGVDTGCLADPDAAQFVDYTEDNPKNWRSAFAVLTFHKGRMLCPELVLVADADHVEFRGELIRV